MALGRVLVSASKYKEAIENLISAVQSLSRPQAPHLNGDAIQDLNAPAMTAQRTGHLREAENYLNRMLLLEDTLNGGKNRTASAPLGSSFLPCSINCSAAVSLQS